MGGERDCINIIVPSSCYSLSKNQLKFRNAFKAKLRFYTEYLEGGGHALIENHLQQNTKVRFDGTIINDSKQDFWEVGNVFYNPVFLSFSLEDGSSIRLGMNTMTVVDDVTLFGGWLL